MGCLMQTFEESRKNQRPRISHYHIQELEQGNQPVVDKISV